MRLIPAQHWDRDRLKGVSVHVLDDKGQKFVGWLTIKPMDLGEVVEIIDDHFKKVGYATIIQFFGGGITRGG